MKQAQVASWGEAPKCIDTADPPAPSHDDVQVKVLAAGLHQLVRGRASGNHYSANVLPHIPGVDGVGTTVPDGKLVYFSAMSPQGGSFTELVNVPKATTTSVPDGADAVQVAGLVNPVMASWMAIKARTMDLPPKYTVLILNATGLSGSSAVAVSRALGAGKVIGAGRNVAKMDGLGLDATIKLEDDVSKIDFSPAYDVDLILDFLYGPAVLALLEALKPTKPVQYVQIGTPAASTIDFPGDILRGKDIIMRGTGYGAWSMDRFAIESVDMIKAITDGRVKPAKFQVFKLADIEQAWAIKGGDRVVITPD